jgi:hypothetical protein
VDLSELTPSGGGNLSCPVMGPHGRPVATFTPAETPDPADLWEPFTRTTDRTRDASQGDPFGRPGHGLEHEPVDRAERDAQKTAQSAAGFQQTATQIRAALRGGIAG